MTWKGERNRHALAARGVKTTYYTTNGKDSNIDLDFMLFINKDGNVMLGPDLVDIGFMANIDLESMIKDGYDVSKRPFMITPEMFKKYQKDEKGSYDVVFDDGVITVYQTDYYDNEPRFIVADKDEFLYIGEWYHERYDNELYDETHFDSINFDIVLGGDENEEIWDEDDQCYYEVEPLDDMITFTYKNKKYQLDL